MVRIHSETECPEMIIQDVCQGKKAFPYRIKTQVHKEPQGGIEIDPVPDAGG